MLYIIILLLYYLFKTIGYSYPNFYLSFEFRQQRLQQLLDSVPIGGLSRLAASIDKVESRRDAAVQDDLQLHLCFAF